MKKQMQAPRIFNSLIELNKVMGLSQPLHPLITLSNFHEATGDLSALANGVILNFYQVSFKQYYSGSIRYGQNHYDYAGGGLSFIAPNQFQASGGDDDQCEGVTLVFHPDFLKGSNLAKNIRKYNYFFYSTKEALQLSDEERKIVQAIFDEIARELTARLDQFSQDVLISQIELLLNYSLRFYHRQFLTRRTSDNDLLSRIEELLENYFEKELALKSGVLTVQYVADSLALSPGYLSDLLKNATGLTAQQHIHLKMVEKAKAYLAFGQLTNSQISYKLGFEHPQSFSKLFRKKTNSSPNEYKHALN